LNDFCNETVFGGVLNFEEVWEGGFHERYEDVVSEGEK
jgi:hypothetical protein